MTNIQNSSLVYPAGAVRITKMHGLDNDPAESVSLPDILDAANLRYALLTAYLVDEEWLLSHIGPATNVTLVLSGTPPSGNAVSSDSGVTRVYPELFKPEVQIMHSKLMLLFYAHHVRLVISTANLIKDDWSIMQNAVFIQDFPLVPDTVVKANQFKRLSRVISDIKGTTNADVESLEPDVRLYCSGSSMGRLDRRWLWEFYLAALGVDLQSTSRHLLTSSISDKMVDIAVAFHTEEQAAGCRYGDQCRQHIMCSQEIYEAKEFPKDMLFRLEPRFADTLVHAKLILARTGVDQKHGWMYIGSHNFGPAAWGRVYQDRKPYFNNYELGVVIPDAEFRSLLGNETAVFWKGEQVPLPFKAVWEPYGRGDTPVISKQ
ncbi:phospholipase D/nuclease [Martensiomyces pterosporus]|nr:phospholipase D/nuclease [Martensiomyces pterosporus]